MYSFSTCWNSHRHTEGRAMLEEIAGLGFQCAELSHGIRISLLPGIVEAVSAGVVGVSSLHNFCPLPMGVTHAAPNLFQFSSENPRERESAHRHTVKTIETAARVGAGVVVLHLGSVEMKEYTGRLVEMAGAGEAGSERYRKLCLEMEKKREARKEGALDRVREALGRLVPVAREHGVQLVAENREAAEELPFEADFPLLLREFPGLGYWHDTGHAQIKEHLGLGRQAALVEMLSDRLVGFHLHDVEFPARDHRAPGSGTVKFEDLKPWVRPGQRKVFEFSPGMPVELVRTGIAHVKAAWGEE